MSAKTTIKDVLNYVKILWPDFEMSEQQLKEPTTDFVVSFYRRFRQHLDELTEEVSGSKREGVPNQNETLIDIMRYINKYMRLFNKHGLDCNLIATDLYAPTSKRTVIRFKLLLTFLMYYEDRQDIFKDVASKALGLVEEKKLKEAKVEHLAEENLKATEELRICSSRLDYYDMKNIKAKERYKKVKEEKKAQKGRIDKLKLDLQALIDTYESKENLITEIKRNIQHLNEQIVTLDDYENLLDLKGILNKECVQMASTSKVFSDAVRRKKPVINHLKRLHSSVQNLILIATELKEIQNIVSEKTQELQTLRDAHEDKTLLLDEANEKAVKLNESINAKNDAAELTTLEHNTEKECIEQKIQDHLKEIKEEKEDVVKQEAEYNDKIDNLDNLIKNVKESISALDEVYKTQYKKLVDSENKIAAGFKEKIDKLKELFENHTEDSDDET